jgi:hypothetical protein
VGDHDPVHSDAIVITEIQFLYGELSAIVIGDRVGDPEIENDALDETHGLFGANLSQGLHLNLLSKFINLSSTDPRLLLLLVGLLTNQVFCALVYTCDE